MCHRARTDQAHLTLEHAPELWQFVQAGFAQHATQGGHARIVAQLATLLPFCAAGFAGAQQRLQAGVGIRGHGAELGAAEGLAMAADALMPEQDGAPFDSQTQGQRQQYGPDHQQQADGAQIV